MKRNICMCVFIAMIGASIMAVICRDTSMAIVYAFWASLACYAKNF